MTGAPAGAPARIVTGGGRLVLEQLSRHYQRPFADQWDFVGYVQQQKLDLDLTTPPVRSRMLR